MKSGAIKMRRTDDVWCSVQMHAIGEVEICVQKFPHLASRPPEYLNRGREEKKKRAETALNLKQM